MYLLPFYLAVDPDAARSLLLYRYKGLESARKNAIAWGYRGARFPWTSTSTGLDVTPPDWPTTREIHISGAVALSFAKHLDWTGDIAFYNRYGVEVIVGTALFYASRVVKGADDLYHLEGIVGPDEYNTKADDNYYTMFLAGWNMRQALTDMEMLRCEDPELYRGIAERSGWSDSVKNQLTDIASRLAFPRQRDNVCEQCRCFFDFLDLGITERGEYSMPIVEKYSYDTSTQRSKQADAVMMHFLFENAFSMEVMRASYEYYNARCTQGSSLSPPIYCIMGLKVGLPQHAYGYFQLTSLMDLKNLHLDKNVREGIHAACAGGAWMAVVLGYGGVSVRNGILAIEPTVPTQWQSLAFSFQFRGRLVRVRATPGTMAIRLEGEAIRLLANGCEVTLDKNGYFECGMADRACATPDISKPG